MARVVRKYHTNGLLKEEKYMIGENREGNRKYYYDDGSIMYDTYAIDGKISGEHKLFLQNGNLLSIRIYFNDKMVLRKQINAMSVFTWDDI